MPAAMSVQAITSPPVRPGAVQAVYCAFDSSEPPVSAKSTSSAARSSCPWASAMSAWLSVTFGAVVSFFT